MSITYIWLLTGFLFLAAEALGASGIGLLFAGLGAVVTGTGISLGLVGEEATVMQFIVFFIAAAVSAALLWKPMQKFRRPSPGYSNIVGETAYVGSSGLSRHKGGEVTWSGTIMKARLAPDAAGTTLDAGAQVIVTAVQGATLVVKPKE